MTDVSGYQFNARPDNADFRDVLYKPSLINVPPVMPLGTFKRRKLPILDQGKEGACTGFGLATVAHYLLRTRPGGNDPTPISASMLYHNAQLNDRWPGEDYSGSSCRGAIKGWHKNGVCAEQLWPHRDSPWSPELSTVREDAAKRPLGAYYRVNSHNLNHIHAAMAEVGVLFASCRVHKGWHKPSSEGKITQSVDMTGGHAFAIAGYDAEGFWIQNSWGARWGAEGFCHLSYADWLKNGTDVWVCRLGVPVSL